MAIKEFNVAALAEFDGGRVAEALNAELKRVMADLKDRPKLEKVRSVGLQINLEPIMDEHGDLDGASLSFQIKSSIPERKTKGYNIGIKADGRMFYSEHSTDNINQRTILDNDEE